MNKHTPKVIEFNFDGSKVGMNIFQKNGQFAGLLWIPSPEYQKMIQTLFDQRGEEANELLCEDILRASKNLCEAYGIVTPNFDVKFIKGHTEKAADRSGSSPPK